MNISDVFVIPKKNEMAKLRLFLFPYAGGAISAYMPWCDNFSNDIELVFVQPPGRGTRMAEKPFDNMSELVDEILQFSSFICDKPSVFFGHSLGSKMAYETCCQLNSKHRTLPLHLIVSGSNAVHINDKKKRINDLPEIEFVEELKRLNGTPVEILENEEFLSLLIPLLRADIKISECYRAEGEKLPIPISAFGGEQDIEVDLSNLKAWKELTSDEFEVILMQGDHFFVNTQRASVVLEVNKIVSNCLNSRTIIEKKYSQDNRKITS